MELIPYFYERRSAEIEQNIKEEKSMKKLITIVLVLVMLVSILVLPAMASEIQPRYPAYRCPDCNSTTTYLGYWDGAYHYRCNSCKLEFAGG